MFGTVNSVNNMKFARTACGVWRDFFIWLRRIHFLKIISVDERPTDLAWRAAAVSGKKTMAHSNVFLFVAITRQGPTPTQTSAVHCALGQRKQRRPSSAKWLLLRSKQWPMPNGSYCILIILSSQFPRRSAESVHSGPAIVAPEIPTGFGRKGRDPATSLAVAGGHLHVVHRPTDVRPLGHHGRPRATSAWAVRLVRLVGQLTPAPRTALSNENNKPRTPPLHS